MENINCIDLLYDDIYVGKILIMNINGSNYREYEYVFGDRMRSNNKELSESGYEDMLGSIFELEIKPLAKHDDFRLFPITVLAIYMEPDAVEIIDYGDIYEYFDTYYLSHNTKIQKIFKKFKKAWKKEGGCFKK